MAPTHDYIISNQSGASFRSDLNNALAAIVSNNSNSTAPATTYAYQWWADTTANQLKLRNSANSDWIVIQELDGTMLMQNGTAAAPGLAFAGDVDTGLFRPAANKLGIATGGTERIHVDASGNVGINTGSPGQLLDVAGDSNPQIKLSATNTGTNSPGLYFDNQGQRNWQVWTDRASDQFRIGNNARAATNLAITSTGRIGIGSINPAEKLVLADVAASSGFSDTAISMIRSNYGGRIAGYLDQGVGGGIKIDTIDNATPTERMRINGQGDILIHQNTVSDPGSGNTTIGACFDKSNTGTTLLISHGDSEPLKINRNSTGGILSFRRDGTERGQVVVNTSSVSYNTSSDYRLKENVVVLDGAISRVKQLLPKRFNFIEDSDVTVDGFIAHEAQTVVPESVSGTQDETEDIGTLTEWDGTVLKTDVVKPAELTWEDTVTDEDGNETTETRTRTWTKTSNQPVYQGIDQAKLVPLLTAALQEAITKIETLETKVAALEAA